LSFTHVQSGGGSAATTATSFAASFSTNTTAGNLVVVAASGSSAVASYTITDSAGNAYQQATYGLMVTGAIDLWWCIAKTTATLTITITPNGSSRLGLMIDEFSFSGGTAVLLGSVNSNTGTSTSPAAGNIVIGGPLVYAAATQLSASGTWTAGSGFTLNSNYTTYTSLGSNFGLASEYNVSEATNPTSPGFTLGASSQWGCAGAAFGVSTPGSGSWAHVQGNLYYGHASSIAVLLPVSVTVGDRVVVGIQASTGSPTWSVTDSQSNTYAQVGSTVTSGSQSIAIYSSVIATGGTITVTAGSGGTNYTGVCVDEYSESYTTTVDNSAGTSGTSTTPSSGSVTVSGTDLLYGFMTPETLGPLQITAGTNFCLRSTMPGIGGVTYGFMAEDQMNVSSNTAAAWTLGASESWLAIGASFKAGSGFQAAWAQRTSLALSGGSS
jgi:hypothetical protein